MKKRIAVENQRDVEVTPIQVAIDQMQAKVTALQQEIDTETPDMKKLQLKLQGLLHSYFH